MKKSVRLQDIAQSLHLSISTVSKALNNSPEISEKTKTRVQELAKQKEYLPNISAQNLKGQNTRNIGVIIPNLQAKFYIEVLNSIEERISDRDYRLVLCISNEAIEKEKRCVDILIKAQVDGVIVCPSRETFQRKEFSHLIKIQSYDKALVIFDRIPKNIYCDKISLDQSLLIEELTLKLYFSGFRNIGFISHKDKRYISERSEEGFLNALKSLHLPAMFLEYCESEEERIVAEILDLVGGRKVDAIIVPTFSLAMEIWECFEKKDKESATASDFIFLSSVGVIKKKYGEIKSFSSMGKEQGRTAADIIIERIEGKLFPEPINVVLKDNLKNLGGAREKPIRIK